MNVVLVGIKHAGKSTLGKFLAGERQSLFVDSDELIEANYHLSTGDKLSCREIFNHVGRDAFRKLEAEALIQLKESTIEDDQERIISVGGGVADNPYITIELLKEIGMIVFIDVDVDVAWKRVIENGIPAYLQSESDPRETFDRMSEERKIYYRHYADLVVEATEDDPQDNYEILKENLKGHI